MSTGLGGARPGRFVRAALHRTRRRVRGLLSPRVAEELVPDEGEFVVDEVTHHWVLLVPRGAEVLGAGGLVVLAATPQWPLVVALPAAVLLGHAGWRVLADHMDRFVITNLRVFRVQGVLSRRTATMPLQRILDITVTTPVLGRLLGYGHFVFESAAQAQGLRDIRYVGSPHERDLTMQRVIQRSGLRRPALGTDQDGKSEPDRPADPRTAHEDRDEDRDEAGNAYGPDIPRHGRANPDRAVAGPASRSSRRRRVGYDD